MDITFADAGFAALAIGFGLFLRTVLAAVLESVLIVAQMKLQKRSPSHGVPNEAKLRELEDALRTLGS